MAHQVNTDALVQFAGSLEREELFTLARGRGFRIKATHDGLEYTPSPTGLLRKHGRFWLDRVCRRFNETRSFKVADYNDLNANASCALAIRTTFHIRRIGKAP